MKKGRSFTLCNPLSLPDIPRGKDDWYPYIEEAFSREERPPEVTGPEYRSVSDPTALYAGGKWYLYPSYGMAWVSEDLLHWTHVRTEPYCMKYSPAITRWRQGFLLTGWMCPLYYGDTPLGPFRKLGPFYTPDGDPFLPTDPALFTDDDGRLYLYGFASTGEYGTDRYTTRIIGYELDPKDPQRAVAGPKLLLEMDPRRYPWERQGFYAQNKAFGWIEGPHMLKAKGRYYLIYASPDTRDPSYAMAAAYSDTSPLGPFTRQKRNPLTFRRDGLVSGPGHGCVEHGPGDSLWAFYTIPCPRAHRYERRVGADPVEIDGNGELYTPRGVTDLPQTYLENVERLNLTAWLRPVPSSISPGREAIYATDQSPLTFWAPDPGDPSPVLTVCFDARFAVDSSRLFWAEPGYDPESGITAGAVSYVIEGRDSGDWFPLLDCSGNREDLNVDFRLFPEKTCREVRLRILSSPPGIGTGVIDFSVFGRLAE